MNDLTSKEEQQMFEIEQDLINMEDQIWVMENRRKDNPSLQKKLRTAGTHVRKALDEIYTILD